jgi:hypothetical protein
MRFRPCDCTAPHYLREHRTGWMRWLIPSQRYWLCTNCGVHFIATKSVVAAVPGAVLPTSAPQAIR